MIVTKHSLHRHAFFTQLISLGARAFALCAAFACSEEPNDEGAAAANASGASGAAGINGTGGVAGVMSVGTGGTAGTMVSTGGVGGVGTGGVGGVGTGGTSGIGTGGMGMPDAGEPDASTSECVEGEGTTEHFSFFVTSMAGLQMLSENEDGFGGDLTFGHEDGLSGADDICTQLAETAYPGAGCKTWRAFLSVTEGPDGGPVHAKDRIGEGPWYDRLGRLVAMTKTDLLADWPVGADPVIQHDLPNEHGVPNHNPDGTGIVDNHNTVTGTAPGGMLYSMDPAFTCQDWTSKVGEDGTPAIGFSWRGGAGAFEGSSWYSNVGSMGMDIITEGGCAPIINLTNQMDFSIRGIGARGGYGGFYCLALEP